MNQRDRNANLGGSDIDMNMNWSTGKTEPELKTHQILVSSLPLHLAPRPVHLVDVVVGLHSPRPRNIGVSLVEYRVDLHLSAGVRALQ